MTRPLGLGIVGVGDILGQYLETFALTDEVEVRFLAGRDVTRAAERAAEHGVPGHGTYDELLADPTVDLVVNLTVPQAHHAITRAALVSGRHVWSEKPLAVDLAEGRELLDLADEHGVRLGCAPDTFLGPAMQTALGLLADGRIGTPRSAHARFQYCGPDYWHPNPSFFFAPGGGPLLDMGPYYLTALVQALGPITRVTALTDRAHETRTVATGPHAGETIAVEVPTHVLALCTFAGGAIADLSISFDTALFAAEIEVSGTAGTLRLPDPNRFDGDTTFFPLSIEQTSETVPPGATGGSGRGSGIVDMARAIHTAQPHRTDARLAFHVLDVMLATTTSAETGRPVDIASRCAPAALLPEGWAVGV
ncbi:Gfo/Idh/MocA family protein [Cellulomonas sp. McL0617]|uniref:Gfo/Idh/MocA family protein n=1 Tax=Cellulomonas sp. McL0617 TaxID=3415675 RepID=UPI003CFB88B6